MAWDLMKEADVPQEEDVPEEEDGPQEEDVPEEADMMMEAMTGPWPKSWPGSWSRPMAKAVHEGVAEVPLPLNSQIMLVQNVEGELKKQTVLQVCTSNSPRLLWPRLRSHRLARASSVLLVLSLTCLSHKATPLVSGPEPSAQAQAYLLCCFS